MQIRNERLFVPRAMDAYRAGPVSRGLITNAATENAPAELLIYNVIGETWDGSGVTDTAVLAALASIDAGAPVTVRINSPGGDVWTGLAIYNALLARGDGVTTIVDGVAASAASFITMAGATREMRQASMMMIHNARGVAWGTAEDMTATAALLSKVDGQLAGIYAGRSGKPAAEFAALMTAETWFTAEEAQTAGLCTAVITPAEPAAQPDPQAAARAARVAAILRTY